MDTRTGELVDMSVVHKLRADNNPTANWFKEIPEVMLGELYGMNRKQRRQWYRDNKKRIREETMNPHLDELEGR